MSIHDKVRVTVEVDMTEIDLDMLGCPHPDRNDLAKELAGRVGLDLRGGKASNNPRFYGASINVDPTPVEEYNPARRPEPPAHIRRAKKFTETVATLQVDGLRYHDAVNVALNLFGRGTL
jgi:hypothetical protein